ncbi:serine/threonine-protein kinase OXI1-like [Syzygium oleosum]|uniref:serine/threonine-protein kinase OXI1-like n=1 Tax=Syzygium oleosum TaxID=219896 RepID=UPI0011D29254|nr:serine/threonine-protein kinase OXI1-like [Syzygium oleosum]
MGGDAAERREVPAVSLEGLKVVSALGRGAKGVVFLVWDAALDQAWALKVILRDNLEKKSDKEAARASGGGTGSDGGGGGGSDGGGDEYRRIAFEQEVLGLFDHPLLPKLRAVVSAERIVGYAIDYCPGRDLNSLRKKQTEKMFSDDIIRFYAAELVLALEYLHGLGIVYRDLKPENVMIQEDGHIMLVDFDLSTKLSSKSAQCSPIAADRTPKPQAAKSRRRFSPLHGCCRSGISPDDSDRSSRPGPNSIFPAESNPAAAAAGKSNSFVGTEEYVAPEIILGGGHDFAVDWWSLGIFLHEMLYGTTPFRGSNRKETFYRILTKEPDLVGETTPLRDLIRRLLEKDPGRRIGPEGIKGHEFFAGVRWDTVLRIQRPPYVPLVEELEVRGGGGGGGGFDVVGFVEGIFGSGGEGERNKEEGENKVKDGDEEEEDGNNDASKKAWVEELNERSSKAANDFLVF